MPQYLLDTDTCIYFLQGKFNISKKIQEVGLESCSISEITVLELMFGAAKSQFIEKNMAEVKKLETLFNMIPIYPSFPKFAVEKTRLQKDGKLIPDFEFELFGKSKQVNPEAPGPGLMDLLLKYMEYKRSSLRNKSHLDYLSRMRVFGKYLTESYPQKNAQFTYQDANKFLEYLTNVNDLHITTRNDYRMFLKSSLQLIGQA